MDFRRLPSWILGQAFVFACGCGFVLAVQGGLYATALVLVLVGAWIVTLAISSPPSVNRPLAPLTPPGQSVPWRLVSSILDQIPAPLVLLEGDGRVSAANREARRLFRTDDRILDPPTPLLDAAALGASDRRQRVSFDILGESRTYALSVIELQSAEAVSRLAMLLDIQAEIRTAEAEALRELMQVLSHEIMNALTPIASLAETAVELLAEGTQASAHSAQGAVEILARRAEGLSRFVDAYRTLARLPSPALTPASVCALLDETEQLFLSRWGQTGVHLVLTRPNPDIVTNIDRDQIVHALMNILSNAADAALEVPERQPIINLSVRRRENGVTLVIADSGRGVPSEDREKVFQPFFTTKPNGTGVGLSFARQVALSHGGDLVLGTPSSSAGAVLEMKF